MMIFKGKFRYSTTIYVVLIMVSVAPLSAQSLWRDHNPYNPGSDVRDGTILKLNVHEPIKIEYDYENSTEDEAVVKIVPDSNLTEFLSPVDANQSITSQGDIDYRAISIAEFQIAVTVVGDPEGNVIRFQGTKLIAQENGVTRQQIQVSGRIHQEDVAPGRNIMSANVADLQIQITGAPIPQDKNIPIKLEPGENPGDPDVPSATLSEAERQQILLEYINRVLGELNNE